MKLAYTLTLLSFAALVAGCAGPRSLVPGQSTETDVRARMGAPRDTRVDANGDLVWEYPTGPEGVNTYFVRLGPDRKLKDVTQVLTEEQLEKVVVGKSSKADVRQLLGRPAEETVYYVGPTWYWRFLKGGVQPGYLVVAFDQNGTVSSKIAIIDIPGNKSD